MQGAWSTAAQDLFGAAGSGARVFGVAYAPAANASDPVALGRASNLVAALPAAASSSQPVAFAALTNSPRPLETGAAGALFVIAWPATVTVGVWWVPLDQPMADQEWAFLTGTEGTDQGGWGSAGTAVLTVGPPSQVVSWSGALPAGADIIHAGYSPGSLATGAAGVQALLNQIGGGNLAGSPIVAVANPPEAIAAGQDGNVFLILFQAAQ